MTMAPFDLAAIALATLYLSHALTKTHGPFDVFKTIRAKAPLGGLTTCMVCAAFWIAAAFYGLWLTPLQPLVWVFAAAGLAVLAGYYTGMAQQ